MTRYDLYLDTFQQIKDATKWELTDDFRRLIALHYATRGTTFDRDRFQAARDTLKQKTRMFSTFRGSNSLVWLSALDATYDPIAPAIDEALQLDAFLDRKHFRYSALRPFLASQLINVTEPKRRLDEATALYRQFKQRHPWLTSDEDLLSALVLVQAFDDHAALHERIESIYVSLKTTFSRTNELQLVSHLLAFSELAVEEATHRLLTWLDELLTRRVTVRNEQLPALALLSLVAVPDDATLTRITTIVEAEKSRQRWFNTHAVLTALQLVAADQIHDSANELVLHGTLTQLLALQQATSTAATMAVISTTSSD